MENTNVVGWFEIYVADMDRALTFYKTMLQRGDFTDYSFGEEQIMGFPAVENGLYASGALVYGGSGKPGGGGTMIYFHSEDCAGEESRVADAGGKVIQSKHAIGEHGFICIVEDTEGNLIGIHSRN